mmetsp:Transcript_19588/g.23355  ORF Transcript_19588/g.23355 Transcript_19588/m.23355 type:complete len:176 (-) Transcript_19588:156-683(-)
MATFYQSPSTVNTFDTEHIKDKMLACFLFQWLTHQPEASNSQLVEMKDKVLKEFLCIDDEDIAFLATKDFRTIQELEKLTLSELNLMNDEEEIHERTYDSLQFYVMWKPPRDKIESMTRDEFIALDRKSIEEDFLQMKSSVAIEHSNSNHIERRQSRHRKQATRTGGGRKSPRST